MNAKQNDSDLRALVSRIRVMTPCCISGMERLNQWLSAAQAGDYPCGLLLGEAGTGKTELLGMFCKKYPAQRNEDGVVRPLLFLETPHRPTAITMLEAILKALGDPDPEKGKRTSKMHRVSVLFREQQVKLVLLDDLQHMVDKNQNLVLYDVSECMKELTIVNHIGFIGSGLPDAKRVIQSNEQLARRNYASIHTPRFDWLDKGSKKAFVGTLKAFQARMDMFELPSLGSEELALRMYLATGGLIDYVAKILKAAVWDALDSNRRKICLRDLELARDKAIFEASTLGPNPFAAKFPINSDLATKISEAKKINQRVPRPVSKRSAAARNALAQIGL